VGARGECGDAQRHRLALPGEQDTDTVRDGVRRIDQRRPVEYAVGRARQVQHLLDTVPRHGEQHRVAAHDRFTRRAGERPVPQSPGELPRPDL
jgi:hypothetical protein